MTAIHEELARVVAAMPAERAQQVLDFARALGPPGAAAGPVEYEDWTEEDMRAASAESMRRFDLEHPENEGYDDLVGG